MQKVGIGMHAVCKEPERKEGTGEWQDPCLLRVFNVMLCTYRTVTRLSVLQAHILSVCHSMSIGLVR